MLVKSVIKLIRSFDDDEGLPEATYHATKEIIGSLFGESAKHEFIRYVSATNGRFYIKKEVDVGALIRRIFEII